MIYNNDIDYSWEDEDSQLNIHAKLSSKVVNPKKELVKKLRKFIKELVDYQTPVKPPEVGYISYTFNSDLTEVMKDIQVFPSDWTCYQSIEDWSLHPKDKEMREYLQYHESVKLLQEFAPVYNVVQGNTSSIDKQIIVKGNIRGLPDEVYSAEYNHDEYTGPRPIPNNLCVKIDEAYFDIPESGPWIYKGIPSPEILKQYQEGTIGTNMDRHAIVVTPDYLYEYYKIFRNGDNWYAGYAVRWDLRIKPEDQRVFSENRPYNKTYGWNSADAAGLPIFPLLIKKYELDSGEINHAIRCTIQGDMIARKWVSPACHQAGYSDSEFAPRYGERLRLKADVDISKMTKEGQVIARALKKYGMIVADGGTSVRMSCAPNVPVLHGDFWQLNFNHFEVVVNV